MPRVSSNSNVVTSSSDVTGVSAKEGAKSALQIFASITGAQYKQQSTTIFSSHKLTLVYKLPLSTQWRIWLNLVKTNHFLTTHWRRSISSMAGPLCQNSKRPDQVGSQKKNLLFDFKIGSFITLWSFQLYGDGLIFFTSHWVATDPKIKCTSIFFLHLIEGGFHLIESIAHLTELPIKCSGSQVVLSVFCCHLKTGAKTWWNLIALQIQFEIFFRFSGFNNGSRGREQPVAKDGCWQFEIRDKSEIFDWLTVWIWILWPFVFKF